jgi:hypothetical protein
MNRYGGVLAGVVAFFAICAAAGFHATPYDNFVLLADALRHGHVWIDWPGAYIDALRYRGRYYVIEAPLPAFLLLPAVMLKGTAVNQSTLAALLGGVATCAGWEIGRVLGVRIFARSALCGFLLLGTDLFWCATFGDVWFIAHVASVAFTLLALWELVGRRRGWLVALLGACAVEARFATLLALPVYAALLVCGTGLGDERRALANGWQRSVASFALTLVPFAVLWVAYNEARWGLPYDVGYTAWYHQDTAGSPDGSPFRLQYLNYQLQSFFLAAPAWQRAYPYLIPSFGGVALTWTSPALLIAFFARGPWQLITAMWVATLLTAAPNFVYYVNGYAQFGMRHALDFEPYVFVLMALALRLPLGVALRAAFGALIAYSMLVGTWGVWYWRAFVRH